MMLNDGKVNCPHCGQKVVWNSESRFKPFCSERCRLIDLGAWLTESHKISETAADNLAIEVESDYS